MTAALPSAVDTLVVGAGTAGCLLAARVAADPGHTVLLLEAGPAWTSPGRAPSGLLRADAMPIGPGSPWVWRYPTRLAEPSEGEGEVRAELVRGRVLGGSGAINGGYFLRATAADFAAWSAAVGDTAHGAVPGAARPGEPVSTGEHRAAPPDRDLARDAVDPPGASGGPAPGQGRESVVERTEPEWSARAAWPAYARLEADREFGDMPGHGAHGPIPVRRAERPVRASVDFAEAASRAGFAEIPDFNALAHLVPESGVGPVPCTVVDGMRVDTATACLLPMAGRANLTVAGRVLVTRIVFRDGAAVGVEYRSEGATGFVAAGRVVVCAGAVESATLLMRSGIGDPAHLRSLGIEVVCPAPVGDRFTDHPEIGIRVHGATDAATGGVPLEYVLALGDVEVRPYATTFTDDPRERRLGVALMRPASTGVLRLRSADPARAPVLAHRCLSEERDRRVLRDALALAVETAAAMPGVRLSPRWRRPDAGWLRAHLGISQHLAGTCPMGRADDGCSVVDAACRVHGVAGLSVVDLSVVPVPLRRGPQATVMMLAERVAERLSRS